MASLLPFSRLCSLPPCDTLLPIHPLAPHIVHPPHTIPRRDVAALGATCRGLRAACGDGEVWHALLHRAFPASALRCCALADYRVAYELEASGAVPELSCFFSRASFETEVLGFAYQVRRGGA